MSRATVFLGLLQVMLVVVGFFSLGVVLKWEGYPDTLAGSISWNPLTVFLREHGFYLLSVPLLWVLFASFRRDFGQGIFSNRVVYITGICFAGAIIALFLYASINPYSREYWYLGR